MRYTWDDFKGDQDGRELAEGYIAEWENFRQHGLGIGLWGPQGNGKTFIAMWIARELVKKKEKVFCINFLQAIEIFKLPTEQRMEAEAHVRESNVLILDEVGKAMSDAQRALFADQLESLIRHRSNYGKITLITTNLSPKELEQEYPRVYSLLCLHCKMWEIKGSDSRRKAVVDREWDASFNGEVKPIT